MIRKALLTSVALAAITAYDVEAHAQSYPSPTFNNVTANTYTGTGSGLTVKSTGSTTLRSLAARFAEVVNVLDYGAKCDGATDDTTALQAAFTAGSGKYILLPFGTCLYTNLTVKGSGTQIAGRGRGATTLSTTVDGGGIFVGDPGTPGTMVPTYNYVFSDLTIFPKVQQTSGAQVHLRNVMAVGFHDFDMGSDLTYAYIGNYVYDGIFADYVGAVHLEQGEIHASHEPFRLVHTTDSAIHLVNLRHAAVALHFMGGVQGFHCSQSNISESVNNLLVDNSVDTATPNQGASFAAACALDTSSGDNLVVNTPLGGLGTYQFTGTSIATENGHAVHIISAPNGSHLSFMNTFIGSYSGTGVGDGIRTDDASAVITIGAGTVICCNTGYGVRATYAQPSAGWPIYIDDTVLWKYAGVGLGNTLGNTNFSYSQYLGGPMGAQSVRVQNVPNAVNGWHFFGAATSNGPIALCDGADPNVNCNYQTSGTGAHVFGSSAHGASVDILDCGGPCANQLQFQGGVTGGDVQISATGTNTNMRLVAPGSGVIYPQNDIFTSNKIRVNGVAPTLSGCGSSPGLVGGSTDTAGTITLGSGATACTLTFHAPISGVLPACIVQPWGATLLQRSISDTAITIVAGNPALTGGQNIDYHCIWH